MRKFLFSLSLVCTLANAEVLQKLHMDTSDTLEIGSADNWIAIRKLKNLNVKIVFSARSGTAKLPYVYTGVGIAMIIESQVARIDGKDYLITFWQDANRITALRVFDPTAKSKQLVFEETSVGELKYEVKSDGIDVTSSKPDSLAQTLKKSHFPAVKK